MAAASPACRIRFAVSRERRQSISKIVYSRGEGGKERVGNDMGEAAVDFDGFIACGKCLFPPSNVG